MCVNTNAPLLTVGQLADRVGVPYWRLTYPMKLANIAPRHAQGVLRLWGEDQLPEIKSAVERISRRREAVANV